MKGWLSLWAKSKGGDGGVGVWRLWRTTVTPGGNRQRKEGSYSLLPLSGCSPTHCEAPKTCFYVSECQGKMVSWWLLVVVEMELRAPRPRPSPLKGSDCPLAY